MDLINNFKKLLISNWVEDSRKTSPTIKFPEEISRAVTNNDLLAPMRVKEPQRPIALQTSPSSELAAETSRVLINGDLLTNVSAAELQELAALRVSPSGNVLAASGPAYQNNLLEDNQTRQFQRPIAFASSQFQKVPAEILCLIRDYLPAPSASMFSVCSMQMYTLIEMSPPRNRQDKVAVGDLLARDLPNKVACSICLRYHEIQHAKIYMANSFFKTGRGQGIPCVRDSYEGDESSYRWIGREFSAVLFKMVMKRYHQNRDATRLLKLMSPKEDAWRIYGYPRLSKTKYRIMEGSLMQRLQTVLVSPKPSRWYIYAARGCDLHLEICPHLMAIQSNAGLRIEEYPVDPRAYHGNLIWEMSWSFLKSLDSNSPGSGVRSCNFCKTGFQIDFKHYPRVGQALFFTRWKNLGAWPDSEDYLRHIKTGYPFPVISGPRAGEVAALFEGGAEYEFDSMMTAENEAQLYNAQKKLFENERKFSAWEKNYKLKN
jgi:hypothetical protein